MKFRHIAIEGPIGVGKTTLARKLAEEFGAEFVSDTESGNPYLETFYRDPAAVALHTQLHFLVSRLAVLDSPLVRQPTGALVADFLLDKDRLFAELTLDETEWWVYNRLYAKVVADVPRPDLVIYLQAPLPRLIERIAHRGLAHEQRIDSHYLQELITLYERFFHDYTASPLLIVNATDINLADSPADLAGLVERIRALDGGRHFYNPVTANP